MPPHAAEQVGQAERGAHLDLAVRVRVPYRGRVEAGAEPPTLAVELAS